MVDTYKITRGGNCVIRNGKDCIPFDIMNNDYCEYLAFVGSGGITEPADPEPVAIPVPTLAEQIMNNPVELAKLKTALGL